MIGRNMDQIRRWAMALPEVVEKQHFRFQVPQWQVRGKTFVGMGRDETTVVCCINESAAERAAADDPDAYQAVRRQDARRSFLGLQVQLGKVADDRVRELVEQAWAQHAPKKLLNHRRWAAGREGGLDDLHPGGADQKGPGENGVMDDAVGRYRDEIAAEHQPVFDRIHQLIVDTCPDADVALSYGMPTYRLGRRRLSVAAWTHGISLYVSPGDGGFSARHPELAAGKGPLKLRAEDAARIPDSEFKELIPPH
jgi:hypothetical protein